MSNRLEAHEIYRRIPHAGAMRLLEAVQAWDARCIVCTARSHSDPHHPLREEGALNCVHAVEYAAQAAAVHASLIFDDQADELGSIRRIYIASLHAIELRPRPLDDDETMRAPLSIRAQLTMASASAARYAFSVACGTLCMARGAMTVATPGAIDGG